MKRVDENRRAVENDILFAARDMIVSMRSGLPLFNAMATVSVGYGAASKEFERIIDRVQLGVPMEQAIEEVSSKSKSPTFKRLMLQASTSIKVGSDVVSAIQDVINDVSQERIIELRRYGQRLNAIAMFYMLFGVIFPSMGLAVISIMSTFISFFPVNNDTLVLAVFALAILQFIFLQLVASSRPAFST
jgi:flagellar protein FlaJ